MNSTTCTCLSISMILATALFWLSNEIPESSHLKSNLLASQPEILYATVNEVAKIE
jgi:hypothetical protein